MCGISGIFSPNGDARIADIHDMNNKISHRGPDNSSYYFNNFIAFGHRRLSIIDLDQRSNQPFVFENLVIVFNGEIYNFKNIRHTLKNAGYSFHTDGDCEVIIKAYHMWGKDCVNHFKGMWAFAIYDKDQKFLFCSRDRFGIKPFYYKFHNSNFYFGSEIKQLCGDQCAADFNNVLDYLIAGYVDHTSSTFFDGILQLLPGCSLTIENDISNIKIFDHFDLNADLPINDCSEINKILDDSIAEHLVSDVKLGSCLSGGLDSSYINHRISEITKDFVAIHSNSTDASFSEIDKAQLVASSLGIMLEVVEPTIDEFNSDLEHLIYIQEQPFGDPSVYMQYRVMERAHSLGIKVMLDGQGADEVFMGYPKYLGLRLWDDFSLTRIPSLFSLISHTLKNNSLSLITLIRYSIGTKFEVIKRISLLLKSKIMLRYWFAFIKRGRGHKTSKAFQYSEIYQYPLQTLLRNEDRNSMWFSIEARVPYLDHELVTRLYNTSTRDKVSCGWSKSLLRDAAIKVLPPEIVFRKDKLGFNSPSSWLDQISYSEIFESKILHKIFGSTLRTDWLKSIDVKLRWRLLSVAIWEKVYNVNV